MKKSSVLWLLPLAAVLFIFSPSALFAGGKKDTAPASPAPAVPAGIQTTADTAQLEALKQTQEAQAEAFKQAQEAQAEALTQAQDAAKEAQEAARQAQEALKQALEAAPAVAQNPAEKAIVPEVPADIQNKPGTVSAPRVPAEPYLVDSYPADSPNFVSPAPRRPGGPGDTAIPDWVLDPNKIKDILEGNYPADTDENKEIKAQNDFDNMIFGIGSAKSSTTQLSIQMAEARARQDIAFQVGTQIQAKITDFAENQGNKDGDEFNFSQDSVTERIGQQLTDIELKGLKVVKREKGAYPDDTWWVLVAWSKAAAVKATDTIAEKVIEVEVIAPAARAKAAAQLLDDQLDKAKLKPAAVSE